MICDWPAYLVGAVQNWKHQRKVQARVDTALEQLLSNLNPNLTLSQP